MDSASIRQRFLRYFESKHHTIVPSSPVIPHGDPTLLFSNAGMNQFKDVFLGQGARNYARATTSQKCMRAGGKHNDLENVGHTSRHLTFFEMLGNFSFGDYFKKEAIAFAWEVSTEVFGFDEKRIYPTVFREDDEAFELWTQYVPVDRITRMDEADNFWMMGETGPCGPCSELYYDRGPRFGDASRPSEDKLGERYLEFWNLVFMQYNRHLDGRMEKLSRQSIDTGSGLERVMSLKMGVDSVFETDILLHLIQKTAAISGRSYDGAASNAACFRVIADHLRSLAFAIADGARPGNVERGYVLRKILRRSVRYGKNLGFDAPFLGRILPALIEVMGQDYPELQKNQAHIAEILTLEEESFFRTLRRGGRLLEGICQQAKRENREIRGEEAFSLKDTYGLPLEEIKLLAHDETLCIDEAKFHELEKNARELSRSQHKKTHQLASDLSLRELSTQFSTDFVGYTEHVCDATLHAILVDGKCVDTLIAGKKADLILSHTPFYAEKGGQVSDTGHIEGSGFFVVEHVECKLDGLILHTGYLKHGELNVGAGAIAYIDVNKRRAIERAHTATHLLHWALVQVLGDHIVQKGSLVDVDTLRFDFSHLKAVSKEQLQLVERMVQEKILLNVPVKTYEKSFNEVKSDAGIKQFFADKYGDAVRIVDIDFSKELCGGTHVKSTAEIGYLRLERESSIASGIRRLEAVVGEKACNANQTERHLVQTLCENFKVQPVELVQKIDHLQFELTAVVKRLEEIQLAALTRLAQELTAQASMQGSIPYVEVCNRIDIADLPKLGEQLKSFSGVCALVTASENRALLVIHCGAIAREKGLHAGKLIQEFSHLIEGKGGGRPDLAQAGGKKVDGLEIILQAIRCKVAAVGSA